ncbi:Branched-chain amino acid transport protein (AzlD) [Raineyella antarctica]|uniref:Branched-chain amino acid transport protein (AzlD) n=1 Tax=Raineyella antarctica TaxID=1577474 RepID=A0A1G6GPQ4_9ACTN|nr:AzlD domain-containing protein [Raineyella antarctica]SDB83980.1 Branched-chain amino acid transport protein (AzlD) [Raineyella antarctica]
MTMWIWIIVASLAAYVLKLTGYLVPERVLEHPRMARVTWVLTLGLLSALVVMNTFASGTALVADARVAAFVVAVVALVLRAPFLLVVVLGAAAAALTRALGWG